MKGSPFRESDEIVRAYFELPHTYMSIAGSEELAIQYRELYLNKMNEVQNEVPVRQTFTQVAKNWITCDRCRDKTDYRSPRDLSHLRVDITTVKHKKKKKDKKQERKVTPPVFSHTSR